MGNIETFFFPNKEGKKIEKKPLIAEKVQLKSNKSSSYTNTDKYGSYIGSRESNNQNQYQLQSQTRSKPRDPYSKDHPIIEKIPSSRENMRSLSPPKSTYEDKRKNNNFSNDPIEMTIDILKKKVKTDISLLLSYLKQNQSDKSLRSALNNILNFSKDSKYNKQGIGSVLSQKKESELLFTSKECAHFIADLFLCYSIPKPSHMMHRDSDFRRLYSNDNRTNQKIEKLEKIFDYFTIAPKLERTLIFSRYVQNSRDKLSIFQIKSMMSPLTKMEVYETGFIESKKDATWVDFANKYVGGGVLGNGYVQEEKMFSDFPELLVAMQVSEPLLDHECIMMNIWSEKEVTEILAIDAYDFSKDEKKQYQPEFIDREINKASFGFSKARFKNISTGKWGCGIFKGDPQLKFVIQWIAGSIAKKGIMFHTCGDKNLAKAGKIIQIYQYFKLGILMNDVIEYLRYQNQVELFSYLIHIRGKN